MKIAVVGLGLIGGSIYKKLMQLGYEVVGISNSQSGKAENITNDLNTIKGSDIVFVATPINKTLEKLDEINQILDKNTIVTDCCSLKNFLMGKDYNFTFIPSHPMAGTEFQGFEHSDSEMFVGAKWILTPKEEIQETSKLVEVIEKLGARTIFATAKEHDKAVALISHMPMVLSQALMQTASKNELAMKLASSGFRDMTRLAMSNTEMAKDMVTFNAKNIENSLLNLTLELNELLNKNYSNSIENIKAARTKMYKDGKNIL